METYHVNTVHRKSLTPKVNPVTGEGQYAYLIYPNTILGVSETMIFVAQAWPLSPGEMRYDS